MDSSNGTRFSGADSSWWHMERPTNQMAVTAVLIFDGPLDQDGLRALVRSRLLRHDRFRQRVEESTLGFGRPRWVPDPDFSLDAHVLTISLPEGAGQKELQALVGREMSRSLDSDRPLWRMVYVPDFQGGSVLIARLHHCIADGLALVRVLLSLGDDGGEPDSYARFLPSAAGSLLAQGVGMGARAVGSLGRVVGMRPDPTSLLRGPLVSEKRAAWSRPFRLGDLRSAARSGGATLNDVLLCTVAGGLGRFLDGQGERLTRHLRAVVPVNLRRREDMEAMGNRFGLVFAALPVSVIDPMERLATVHQAMSRLKTSPEAAVVYGLLELFGRTPQKALDFAVWVLGSKASLVLTNVPGPRRRIRFCGREMVSLIAWVPQSGRLGLGISVLSYADEVRLGVATDAAVVKRPESLVEEFERSTGELLESVGVSDSMERTV
jgi:diacylglycerol O-acyltransferase / wax synthase